MRTTLRFAIAILRRSALVAALQAVASAHAGDVVVLHADSLAGPLRTLKSAYEATHPGVDLRLIPGVSRELAARVRGGEACDVFASSSPTVIDEDLMGRKIAGTDVEAAAWYVVFSANEMVVITAKGNPRGIRRMSDLAAPGTRFVRVTGDRDLATSRTIEFVRRAAAQEGHAELAQKIIDSAPADPARNVSVPDAVAAVKAGRADAGIVYYSAAIAARNDVEIVRFPAGVNMSEAIRNAATVPGGARPKRRGSSRTRASRRWCRPCARARFRPRSTADAPPVSPRASFCRARPARAQRYPSRRGRCATMCS